MSTAGEHTSKRCGPYSRPVKQAEFSRFVVQKALRWRTWLLHCATSRKAEGSIPSARTVAKPLTEMSTRIISWRVKWPVSRTDNLTTFMCRLS